MMHHVNMQPHTQQQPDQNVQRNVQFNLASNAPIQSPPIASLHGLHGSLQSASSISNTRGDLQYKQPIARAQNSPLRDNHGQQQQTQFPQQQQQQQQASNMHEASKSGDPQRAVTPGMNMMLKTTPRGVSPWPLLSSKRDWSPQPQTQIQLQPSSNLFAGGLNPQRRYESPNPHTPLSLMKQPPHASNNSVTTPPTVGVLGGIPAAAASAGITSTPGVSPQRPRVDSRYSSPNTAGTMQRNPIMNQPGLVGSSTALLTTPRTGPPLSNSQSLMSTMRPTFGSRASSASPIRIGSIWGRT